MSTSSTDVDLAAERAHLRELEHVLDLAEGAYSRATSAAARDTMERRIDKLGLDIEAVHARIAAAESRL
ncbi:hypothetical protein [Nocardia jejuensis]|uniref:hypothetical protein n=1 Tax=Nocardia jejuensis TaxID=328049 RepID=UPI00082DB427|nr:hypothetical protein [Nocardia jejuensis]